MICCLLLVGCSGGGGGGGPAPTQTAGTPTTSGGNTTGGTTGSSNPDPTPGGENPTLAPSAAPFLLDPTTRSLIAPAETSDVSNAVIACTVTLRDDQSCTLSQLPLIGQETTNPTIDDIMERVVVTHPWMGTRFRELLELMPSEILLMMRGITGVVISSEVRPSFYTARTGAMYLDPQGMWLTEAEREVITTVEDPRTDDIQQFEFLILWRYVQDGTDIRSLPRTLHTLRLRTADLLFHELAHANDFFPPAGLSTLDTTVPLPDAINLSDLPSNRLAGTFPLTSSFMRELAQVAFRGNTPTQTQLALTASEVAGEFPADTANDYYNYSTSREDLAMAFEEVMMLHAFGLVRDVAVVQYPPDTEFCDQLIVEWGQRTRIGDSSVGDRSQFVVDRILPEASATIENLLENLAAPTQMVEGVDWCTNIDPTTAMSPRALTLQEPAERIPFEGHAEALIPWH